MITFDVEILHVELHDLVPMIERDGSRDARKKGEKNSYPNDFIAFIFFFTPRVTPFFFSFVSFFCPDICLQV